MKIEDLEKLFARDTELIDNGNLNRLIQSAEQQVAGLYLASIDYGVNPSENMALKSATDKYRGYVDEVERRMKAQFAS